MKTYSKLLSHLSVLSASVFVFCALNVSASINTVGVPVTAEETTLVGLSVTPPSNLQIITVTSFEYTGGANIRCWGQSNGSATVLISGGIAPYTYQWSGLPNQTGPVASGMSAGTYTATVTDALGFSVSGSVTLTQNPPLQGIVTASPILCNGGVSTINVSAVGGAMPYSGLNWYQVTSGTYYYTVADVNGCRSRVSKEISEPPVFQATSFATPILCNGDLSDVSVQGFGGIPPYNGTGLYNESAGTSSYVITDDNGCFAYTSIAITQPPALVADVNASAIKCRGGETQINVTGSGGIAPYMGVGNFTNVAGTYQFTITDGNGCQNTSSIVITQPLAVVAMISNTPIACNGDLSEVQVTASGGNSPYIGTGFFFESAGLHEYNVTDANGCTVDIATIVLEPTEIAMDVSWAPVQSFGDVTDVEVIATGGVAPYVGTGSFTVGTGTHFFTVTDANGCSMTQVISVVVTGLSSMGLGGINGSQNRPMKSNTITDENNSFVRAGFNTDSEELEISYRLEYDSKVRIEILDMTGAIVQVIQEDMAIEGDIYTVSIDSGKLTTGVYIYQFVTDSERQIDKLQVIR